VGIYITIYVLIIILSRKNASLYKYIVVHSGSLQIARPLSFWYSCCYIVAIILFSTDCHLFIYKFF